ncbi:isoleucyl-tRNA synthetase [Antricoccus suffuscus]|uniref:Isoleucine--tRNA ligase n=1 Tax=Antricoccus suffuscus TaxID=1629062 RepID=A0A2T0Z5Q7_9ACTN|nr:isoleucine--tRNA ligase [Antricoccus suffuscus]PRZ31675.1 isoleucyl-tRNA synthetase [Antricoccus suffuscus]
MSKLQPLPGRVDLPALDHEVLQQWDSEDVFARSVAKNDGGKPWVFYEGPPTANGMPGVHHVEARVFKDLYPRFRTMRGYSVPRRAGWDCHGLPVEIAVEKELGFNGKPDIEKYGIGPFNDKCRESVQRNVGEFTALTKRMGYWTDIEHAYWTMNPDYVQSVWWSLKQIFDDGLLVKDHRITPYCPRCGTGLSDHEVSQGYETVVDPSVYVRLPLLTAPSEIEDADLLVWTTTPWTLVSNTAVAVHPDVEYVVARAADWSADVRSVVVAKPLLAAVLGEGATVLSSLPGRDLERSTYQRPFELVQWPTREDGSREDGHFVVLADYVTTEDGTGLVHQSPAFGAEDLQVCRAYGLPVVNPVRADGTFEAELPLVGGVFFKTADKALMADLRERGILFKALEYEHPYPHCWRCHTALLYYALPSWYIRTTERKSNLLRENDATDWHPETVKHGRYGDWLNNNIDWALSRDRYWGTPLPIWINDQDENNRICVGSLKELSQYVGQDVTDVDPHRPYIDDITFEVPGTPGVFRRVPQVIDAWYDSGSMPFAQLGYPHREGSVSEFERTYPADYICEAIDQTRGWFYSLMAVGTMVFDKSSYKSVLCLGHIVDQDGRKMSKHLGNIVKPIPLMEKHGADGLRWLMLCVGNPSATRRVGDELISEVVRKVLLTYWNTASFLSLYADANDVDLATLDAPAPAQRSSLDRWLLSELHSTIVEVQESLEVFDSPRAGRRITTFIDDLSNWYVRRSRRRFWVGDPAALATLTEAITSLTLVMAPFVPFITDKVWHTIVKSADPKAADSVHLADWPVADESLIDPQLSADVAQVRRLVDLGRSARTASKVRTRQPLARALVGASGFARLGEELRSEVADELNVLSLESLTASEGELVTVTAKANFRSLGKKLGKQVQDAAKQIAAADPAALAADVRSGTATVQIDGAPFTLDDEDVIITETPQEGWAVHTESGESVALDLALTPELEAAGRAREAVRLIQDARKNAGLEVTDRITLTWRADDASVAAALVEHEGRIADEVLATGVQRGALDRDPDGQDDHLAVWVERR